MRRPSHVRGGCMSQGLWRLRRRPAQRLRVLLVDQSRPLRRLRRGLPAARPRRAGMRRGMHDLALRQRLSRLRHHRGQRVRARRDECPASLRRLPARLPRRTALRPRAMRVTRAAVTAAALCGLTLAQTAGCGRTWRLGGTAAPVPPPIEVTSWWQKAGAIAPLGGLLSAHHRRFPDDQVIQSGAGLSGLKRRALRARMLRNTPPDAFEANAGGDLLQWALFNGVDASESKLLPLDDLVDGIAAWRQVVPPAVLAQVSYQGKIYGVPVNLYRVNTIFYNERIFPRYGLAAPATLADLPAMAEKLRGSGIPLVAMGSRDPWTLALLTFECLLVAREGPDFYANY